MGVNIFTICLAINIALKPDSVLSGNKEASLFFKLYRPCPDEIQCVPQTQCPAHVMKNAIKPQVCDLNESEYGYCCKTGQNRTDNVRKKRFFDFPSLSNVIIEQAREKFAFLMKNVRVAAVGRGHPDFFHNIVFLSNTQDDNESYNVSASAMEEILAAQIFREKENIPVEEFEMDTIDVNFGSSQLGHNCRPFPICLPVHSTYRNFDGTCNNISPHKTMYGAAGQPMERILPPAYEDGIWLPKHHSVDGSLLTNAREISRILLVDVNKPHPMYNLLVMQFGQFLAHDISQSASIRLESGESIECCSPDGSGILPENQKHFACMPIFLEPHDEFYGMFNQSCMNFVRLSLSPNCRMSYARQRSKVTHFIDASTVYGSSDQTAKFLRSFRGGRLRMFDDFGRKLLPITNEMETCGSSELDNTCFLSGDGRTNQIISLVVIHILFAREHNRIADTLSQLNTHFSDEILYQESRRIVIAQLQHIVYNEYLPLLIGLRQMKRFGLTTQKQGFAKDYNSNVNPAASNEFSGAAFRFGHSTVDGKLYLNVNKENGEVIYIPDVMFNTSRIRKRPFVDKIIKTMLDQPMQQVDGSITHGLSRFLFRGKNQFGLDLASLNIQRGRDHALRSYNDYRELCGRKRITTFEYFPKDISHKLARVYRHPDDVDLWVGGLLEPHYNDGVVGLTFSQIIADQFSRLKHGDRYFYEYDEDINPGAFSLAQLNEIRKSSIARIICNNADFIELNEVSPAGFLLPHVKGNMKLSCSSDVIPHLNLFHWKV